MPAATALSGAELLPVVQNAANRRATVAQVRGFTAFGTSGQLVRSTGNGLEFINNTFVNTVDVYANPSWLSELAFSKITLRPTTLSGYGITDAWNIASGATLTANNTVSGAFNIGFTNNAFGIGVPPASITANTRVDVRGTGTATNNILRLADNTNLQRFLFLDNGALIMGGSALTNENTLLDIQSTTRGVALPRMTTAQRNAILAPYSGLFVYNSTTNNLNFHDGISWQATGTLPDVSTVTSNTTLTILGLSRIVRGNTTSQNIVTTLPTAVGNAGYKITLKRVSAGQNTWTIDAHNSETIDGGLTAVLRTLNESITLFSTGANWEII